VSWCPIVQVIAWLHGKPREILPSFIELKPASRRARRRRVSAQQLDLFETSLA